MRCVAGSFVLILWLAGCATHEGLVEAPGVCTRAIYVSPASATLHVGQTLLVSASTCGETSADFRWSSSADTVASVTAEGAVRALRPGTTVLTGTLRTNPVVAGAMALVVIP